MNTPNNADIERLIAALAAALTSTDAFNEYAADQPNNTIRRQNLRLYLRTMAVRRPNTLLVMEAPGYRGCRLTGVPVTSRKLLLEGVPALNIFGVDRGFRDVNEAGFENVFGEQTATIVWGALAELGIVPFIWNTFPFHPHKPGQALSNRKPRQMEMRMGAKFLTEVMKIWSFEEVIAVGNVARDTLRKMGIECDKVRHPAQGGKNEFVAGLTELLTG